MARTKVTRQQEILIAARKEFISEGIAGARTQAIADNIGVTKAMIHYYFKTKENLFKEVFREASETLMHGLMDDLQEETPLLPKIEQLIDHAIMRFQEYPELAGFVVNELNSHPNLTEPIFRGAFDYDASIFSEQIKEAASNYEITPVEPDQIIANILSLCMFPYVARRFTRSLLEKEPDDYEVFLEKRREVIKDTIINWLVG